MGLFAKSNLLIELMRKLQPREKKCIPSHRARQWLNQRPDLYLLFCIGVLPINNVSDSFRWGFSHSHTCVHAHTQVYHLDMCTQTLPDSTRERGAFVSTKSL